MTEPMAIFRDGRRIWLVARVTIADLDGQDRDEVTGWFGELHAGDCPDVVTVTRDDTGVFELVVAGSDPRPVDAANLPECLRA